MANTEIETINSRPVRQPEDHKPPQPPKPPTPATAKQDVNPVKTIEYHGYAYTVDMRGADDVDVMDALADARTDGDDSAFMAAYSLMLRGMLDKEYPRWKKEQRAVHATHKITDDEDTYKGDCNCEGRLGAYVMQAFIQLVGSGNS